MQTLSQITKKSGMFTIKWRINEGARSQSNEWCTKYTIFCYVYSSVISSTLENEPVNYSHSHRKARLEFNRELSAKKINAHILRTAHKMVQKQEKKSDITVQILQCVSKTYTVE